MCPSRGGRTARRRRGPTDARREKAGHLLPGEAGDPGRTAGDDRPFVDAVAFVPKTGAPRAGPPGRYGRADAVCRRLDRWCVKGVWGRPSPAPGGADLGGVRPDSTTAKAHALVGRRGRPLRLLLDAGREGDAPQAGTLLSGPGPGVIGHVIADAGYDSDATRRRVATRYEKKAQDFAGFIYLAAFVTDNGGE